MMKTVFYFSAAVLMTACLFAQQPPSPGKERDLKYEKDEPVTIKTPTGEVSIPRPLRVRHVPLEPTELPQSSA